jgi:hypothetical protein
MCSHAETQDIKENFQIVKITKVTSKKLSSSRQRIDKVDKFRVANFYKRPLQDVSHIAAVVLLQKPVVRGVHNPVALARDTG